MCNNSVHYILCMYKIFRLYILVLFHPVCYGYIIQGCFIAVELLYVYPNYE